MGRGFRIFYGSSSGGGSREDRATSGPGHLTHQQILVVFSGLVLAMLLAALDSTIVATALPTIVGELGGLERLGWVVTAYLLAQTVVTPLYGKLGDQHGRKIVLQSAIVIFLIGSVLCGMAADMTQLIVFRAIQGLGGGGIMVTTQAVVGDIVPPRDRGRYQGIFGAVFGISSIAGPLLGGYFTTELSWRWIFYINVPFGVLALVVIASTLPLRSERVRHSIDVAGITLLATALSAIVLFADLGGIAYAWTSPLMIGLLVLSVVALGGAFCGGPPVIALSLHPALDLKGLLPSRTYTYSMTVLDREALEVRDGSTPIELLVTLPQVMNVPLNETATLGATARGDNSSVSLRGIPSSNTLILLIGRRLVRDFRAHPAGFPAPAPSHGLRMARGTRAMWSSSSPTGCRRGRCTSTGPARWPPCSRTTPSGNGRPWPRCWRWRTRRRSRRSSSPRRRRCRSRCARCSAA